MVKLISATEKEEHAAVKRLDLQNGIIDLVNGKGICGYFTHLPISSPEYREKHSLNLAEFKVAETIDEIVFNITDDYGWTYVLIITDEEMKNPIVQDEVKVIKALQRRRTK